MPAVVKLRLVLPLLLAAIGAVLAAGCGGSSGGGTDPATVAPANTPIYIDFTIKPEGETKANIEELAHKLAGVDDLGALIVTELEESADEEGEEVDFEKEIQPWLGERAGFIYPRFEGGDFRDFAAAIQVTDAGEAEAFVENQAESGDEKFEDGSFEGVDFKVGEDGTAVGVIDELLVIASEAGVFEEVVTASEGESLADEGAYTDAISNVSSESAANVYVDIGNLLSEAEAGGEVDQSTKLFFENAGVELSEATAVASLLPGTDQLEIDVSSNATGDTPPSGDASQMLESLPASSLAAFASPEFGKRFNEGIDQIDEQGIPGQVPPHQLKQGLKQAGIDLESIASGITPVAAFVDGPAALKLASALVPPGEEAFREAKRYLTKIDYLAAGSEASGGLATAKIIVGLGK